MFQFQPAISEGDAIKSRIASKNTDSPSEQPENTEVVNVSEDTPIEEVVETEAQANEEVTAEIEETAEEVTKAKAQDEETDLFYYDIDGEAGSPHQLNE